MLSLPKRSFVALAIAIVIAANQVGAQESDEGKPGRADLPELPDTVVEAPDTVAEPPATPDSSGEPSGTISPQSGASPNTPFNSNPPNQGAQNNNREAARTGAMANLIGPNRGGTNLAGQTDSASSGVFGPEDLQFRPLLRPGSALELIPGLIVTQHSGSGKANQYFLRGVNLDHGTDFNLRVDGVPINLPTHGHGQGYLDINWLIPELMQRVDYRLGTYYADVGDFGSVGAADIQLARRLPHSFASVTGGGYDYWRMLGANSSETVTGGDVLVAFEGNYNNGPWVVPEKMNKLNGLMKFTQGTDEHGFSVTAMAYGNHWNATNQIARRSFELGLVDRFGSLNPSDGGSTNRVTGNAQYWYDNGDSRTTANIYVAQYALNLYSDFTYFLDDPIHGDQINQVDQRVYSGVNIAHEKFTDWGSNTVGFQFRNDLISSVALNHTEWRQFLDARSQHDVDQQSFSLYAVNKRNWTDWTRTSVGLRGDMYRFHTNSIVTPQDSGTVGSGILNPKTSIVFGPWLGSELFANWGLGFHSNDARGVTSAIDPATPLVRSNGSEIGTRSRVTDNWTSTMTLWYLEIDSELVFVGDAGTTEAAGASHRGGFNWTNFVQLNDYTTFDCDYAYVRPRLFGGERIPNAVENVLATGLSFRDPQGGLFGALRVQSYGPAALIEDNSARSDITAVVNLQTGYAWERARITADVYNVLNTKQNDITYFYESAPPGLPPAADYHFHPVQPTTLRLTGTWFY